MQEIYKGFQIKSNKVPKTNLDFGGFGWAYRILVDQELLFEIVVKTNYEENDKNNIQTLHEWGMRKSKAIIDMNNFEKTETYCFQWLETSKYPKEVDCKGFLLLDK